MKPIWEKQYQQYREEKTIEAQFNIQDNKKMLKECQETIKNNSEVLQELQHSLQQNSEILHGLQQTVQNHSEVLQQLLENSQFFKDAFLQQSRALQSIESRLERGIEEDCP